MALGGKGTEQFTTPIGTSVSMDAPVFVPVGKGTLGASLASAKPTANNIINDNFEQFTYGTLNETTKGPDISSALGLGSLTSRSGGNGSTDLNSITTGTRATGTGSTDLSAITTGRIVNDAPLDLSGVDMSLPSFSELTDEAPVPTVTAEKPDDYRVRLSALTAAADQVYGKVDRANNVLSPLHATNGLLFPYTPTITQNQTVNWEAMSLVGTNYDVYGYKGTPSVSLSVSAVFTAQNQYEGEYCAAALHFLRTVSKSYFGIEDNKIGKAGLPPPVLRFHGYGSLMFKNVYCVVKNFSYTLEDSVDMNLFVLPDGNTAKIPAKFTISLELGVQQNPSAQRDGFSLDKFRTGELMRNSSGWI